MFGLRNVALLLERKFQETNVWEACDGHDTDIQYNYRYHIAR